MHSTSPIQSSYIVYKVDKECHRPEIYCTSASDGLRHSRLGTIKHNQRSFARSLALPTSFISLVSQSVGKQTRHTTLEEIIAYRHL